MSFYCPVHICNPFYYYYSKKETRIYFWSYSIFSQKKISPFQTKLFFQVDNFDVFKKDLIKQKKMSANVTWRRRRKSALFFRNIIFFSQQYYYVSGQLITNVSHKDLGIQNEPSYIIIHAYFENICNTTSPKKP